MRYKFNPLTFDQKLALRRSAEDAINAMNPLWGEFRKAATAPAIISLLDSLDEQAQELHKTKMALADAGCALVEWKQRVETTEQQLEEMTIYRDNAIKKIVRANERTTDLERLTKLPKGFLHQNGAIHALLGSNDVMVSHIEWTDAHGIAFSPVPAGKTEIGVNFDADIAGKSSDEIGSVFVVKATSVQSLELLKEAVQMAIDGFKAEEAL